MNKLLFKIKWLEVRYNMCFSNLLFGLAWIFPSKWNKNSTSYIHLYTGFLSVSFFVEHFWEKKI